MNSDIRYRISCIKHPSWEDEDIRHASFSHLLRIVLYIKKSFSHKNPIELQQREGRKSQLPSGCATRFNLRAKNGAKRFAARLLSPLLATGFAQSALQSVPHR